MTEYLRQVKITFEKREGLHTFKAISSKESADALRFIIPEDSIEVHETCVAIFLNQANESIGWFMVSQGGITGSVVDVRMIFSAALNCLAVGIILCHNHPSGNLKPSAEDIKITKQLEEAGRILNIKLLDHIILTRDSHTSFADEGLINW